MKKRIIIILFLIIFLVPYFGFSSEGESVKSSNTITKTYKLNYISAREAISILKPYVVDYSYSRSLPSYLTVVIYKNNIKNFEALLKKIDQPKKNIFFKIYTIVASREKRETQIKNPELLPVINEIKKLFAFKGYKLDGISSIIVKEQNYNFTKIKLTSSYNLLLILDKAKIKKGDKGDVIEFGFYLKNRKIGRIKGKDSYETIISSRTFVKNNTYFVAGVSSLGENGDSIILVFKVKIL